MTVFWIFILIFGTMYTIRPGRRRVSAQSVTQPPIYQPDKELSVDIGASATLRCCVSENVVGTVVWLKQPRRKKPQTIVTVYITGQDKHYRSSQNSHFQTETFGNCFNTTILKTTQSDEAMYYCAHKSIDIVFGDGTYIKIQETSKPALCDDSELCESTLNGNSTDMNTHQKTVLGLGTALGLCALLILCLVYFLLRRRKCDEMSTSVEDSPGMRQESEAETLNYAALQFPKRKDKTVKRKTGSSEDCVYSEVGKKSVFPAK